MTGRRAMQRGIKSLSAYGGLKTARSVCEKKNVSLKIEHGYCKDTWDDGFNPAHGFGGKGPVSRERPKKENRVCFVSGLSSMFQIGRYRDV
jgi:hypothetical protein